MCADRTAVDAAHNMLLCCPAAAGGITPRDRDSSLHHPCSPSAPVAPFLGLFRFDSLLLECIGYTHVHRCIPRGENNHSKLELCLYLLFGTPCSVCRPRRFRRQRFSAGDRPPNTIGGFFSRSGRSSFLRVSKCWLRRWRPPQPPCTPVALAVSSHLSRHLLFFIPEFLLPCRSCSLPERRR